jgi:uncharacterized protein
MNGTLEELLWRGVFVTVFHSSWLLGVLLPTIGFAVWHVAPQLVHPSRAPGRTASFVLVSGVLGLMWGRVAFTTGSILRTAISHVLFDFSGLRARVYR